MFPGYDNLTVRMKQPERGGSGTLSLKTAAELGNLDFRGMATVSRGQWWMQGQDEEGCSALVLEDTHFILFLQLV